PGPRRRSRRAAAVEALEDLVAVAGRDAGAEVAHTGDDLVAVALRGDVDLAARRRLHQGVVEEIAQERPPGGGGDLDLADLGVDAEGKAMWAIFVGNRID